jgi:hypothetical protein
MDARIKSGHDECVCVHTNLNFQIATYPGLLATVAGGIASADLIPASRDQDHTPWQSASRAVRYRRIRVNRIPSRPVPRFVTIASRPQAKFPKFRN